MNIKKSILVLSLLVICSLILSLAFHNNLGLNVRIFNDYWDRSLYAERGSWFTLSKTPYTEVFSEYPQVATYFFALPYILMETIIPQNKIRKPIEKISNRSYSSLRKDLKVYAMFFSLLMMIFSFLSISILYKFKGNLSFLILLPASFYFTFNRYDIMPCFLSLLSLYLLSKKQYKMTALVLSIGVLTKWYLILLLPIFLSYYYSIHKKINWSMIFTFSLTSFVIILPTIFSGGIDGLLVPYKFHWSRGMNRESSLYIINYLFNNVFNINIANKFTFFLFLLLQFSIVPLCITSKIVSFDKVIKWSALSILIFLLFAKYYSPQWILWISPFLILNAKKRSDIAWIILFDLLTFIYFPISFDLFGKSILFVIVISLKTIFLIKFIIPLFCELIKDNAIFTFAQKQWCKI